MLARPPSFFLKAGDMMENCKQCGQEISGQDEDGLCDECHYENEAINQRDLVLEERRLEI